MIRYATKADAPRIHQLIKDLAKYEKAPLEAKATLEQIEETIFGENPVAYCHVAEDDGLVVGISIWFLNYSTWVGKPGIYLEDLFVLPEYRGHGIGKLLLTYLAKVAVARDCGRLEWSVLDWNQPAIDFYHSQGATMMHDWRINRVTGEKLTQLAAQCALQ
mgnify:CR=1 FL=1